METRPSCPRGPLVIHDSFNITCRAFHYGPHKWYKIDPSTNIAKELKGPMVEIKQNVTIDDHIDRNMTLRLRNVTKRDAGVYVCSKSNGKDATMNITFFIDVLGKLMFLQFSKNSKTEIINLAMCTSCYWTLLRYCLG